MGYTRFKKVVGSEGVYSGAKGSEVQLADASGNLYIQGVQITANAAELNAAAGTGVSATELGLLDGSIAGTAVANKALALGADKNVDTLAIADSGLKLGAGAGTAVTSTAAELNLLDGVTATTSEINKSCDYLSNSDTWDPGSIADGDMEAKDITVTGAALGDFVLASFSLDVTDLTLSATVTATNTVTVVLANNTGGAVDLGSGTVKVRVFAQ